MLRTQIPSDAKILARRLTQMSDLVFAAVAEMTTMALSAEQPQEILVKLARFKIEAFEQARRVAPARSPEAAAFDLAREAATQETLRLALFLRDREVARAPLRHVAQLLGARLDEDSEDWRALAIEATRVLLDVSAERARRDQDLFEAPSPAFRAARAEIDAKVPPRPMPQAVPLGPSRSGCVAMPAPCPSPRLIRLRAPRWLRRSRLLRITAAAATQTVVEALPPAPVALAPASAAPERKAPPSGDPRDLGSTFLSTVTAPSPQSTEPALAPVARPVRSPGQEEIFRFYLKHLSPESQAAALRAEGPGVEGAF